MVTGDLEGEQQQEGLDTVEAAVDEVAHEQVVGVWHIAAHLEQLTEVIELTVDVATNLRTISVVHCMRRARTVTGGSTRCTLLSSARISLAFAHRDFTSLSLMSSHLLSCSICLSKSLDIAAEGNHVKQKRYTRCQTESASHG